MEQNLSEETANKWQNHSFIFYKALYQTLQATKTNFEQMLG